MISVSKLLCGKDTPADGLRYGSAASGWSGRPARSATERRPIVVWNSTKACNLKCAHCYYAAGMRHDPRELTTAEAKRMIDDLAAFGAPVLLFSGGEPLMRHDLCELGSYAAERGIRTVISTNGTLLGRGTVKGIRAAGFSYVGISLDGVESTNDVFRGVEGAFAATVRGIRNCMEAGVRVGLRLTLNRGNVADLNAIFDLLEEERIPRACFYHLVYAGRGKRIQDEDLSLDETRGAVDLIVERTVAMHARGFEAEILTVDNHADAPYLLRHLERSQPERAAEAARLLRWNGGNSSGIGIAAVDHLGYVHADQFWQHHAFGNVRERPFGDIWMDTSDPLMAGLKNRQPLLKGRCASCRYLDLCNGNFRVRAEAVYNDVWAPDPACYLTDDEVRA